MRTLNSILVLGIMLRPLQIGIMGYLALIQAVELRRKTPYQPIKRLLLTLFITNALLYTFSLFIDMVGIFHWWPRSGLLFLTLYLAANVLSAMLTSVLLIIIYRVRIVHENNVITRRK